PLVVGSTRCVSGDFTEASGFSFGTTATASFGGVIPPRLNDHHDRCSTTKFSRLVSRYASVARTWVMRFARCALLPLSACNRSCCHRRAGRGNWSIHLLTMCVFHQVS